MLGVVRVDPHGVVVLVDSDHAGAPRVSAVIRELEIDRHSIDAIRVPGVDSDLREVERPVVDGAHPLPGAAGVGGAIEAAEEPLWLLSTNAVGFDECVDDVRIAGRDGETDAPLRGLRKAAALDLAPGAAAVGRLPQR